jgi:hypothetical protein
MKHAQEIVIVIFALIVQGVNIAARKVVLAMCVNRIKY